MFTVKDITAHNSSDNGTHAIRNRPEGGETSYTSVSPIDYEKNHVEDGASLEEPMIVYESNCSDVKNHNSKGNSISKLEAKIEKNQYEVLAKSDGELAKSHKPVSDMKREASEDDCLRRTSGCGINETIREAIWLRYLLKDFVMNRLSSCIG